MDHRWQSGEQAAGLCRWYFCGALSWPKQLRPDQLRGGICGILCLALYLGINSVIVKNFVDHPDQQGETIGTTLLLRAISSLLSALAIIGIVSVVDRGERLTIVVVALYSIGLIFQVFDTLNYWFQARLQSKYSAIAELVSYAAMSVYKIILLALGKSVEWFAVASALDYIVLAVFLLIAYFKNGGTRFRYSLEKAKELLQSSGSFIIAGLMVSIYACTDKLMLKQMLGADAVGHYSLASTVSVSWAFILSASLIPFIRRSCRVFRKTACAMSGRTGSSTQLFFMCPCSYPQ